MNTELIKLMLDYRRNAVSGNFSKDDSKEVIRQALIEANGGSTTLNIKTLMRGRNELFDIIETLVDKSVAEGLKGNEFFVNMAESRNLAEGDKPEFVADVDSVLVVSDVARGTQGIRRQRIGEKSKVTLTPTPHAIKIYEELSRILAGNADINDLVDAVIRSVEKQMLDDVYGAWNNITSSTIGATYYPVAGAYSEDNLIDLIDHVSAANDGVACTLVSTLKGVRKIAPSIVSNSTKEDYYNRGYSLKWNGVNVQVVPQRHQVGSETFLFDNDKIYVIPTGMDKPIKQVIGGESLLVLGNPTDNADLSQEFTLISNWTTGVFTGKKFGVYEIA